jgi:hypothetical protein
VVRDNLSEELIEAGYRLLFMTDVLKMQAQGAMWIRRHDLNDWRYYLVTSLVDAIGRRAVYKLLLRIFGAPGGEEFFSKDFTIEDVHLGSPTDEYYQRISSGIANLVPPTGKNRIIFTDYTVSGITFDAVVYRAIRIIPSAEETAKVEKQFKDNVHELETRGAAGYGPVP